MPIENNFDGVYASTRPKQDRASESKPNGSEENGANGAIFASAGGLKIKVFLPIKSIADGYIVEGATILAGKPKIGKSWFALDCGLAVADGGMFLGTYCKKGDVLFIALEDNERRLFVPGSRKSLEASRHGQTISFTRPNSRARMKAVSIRSGLGSGRGRRQGLS
jgi:AAA domain